MRTALSLADAALVLLDRVAMARQTRPFGAGPNRPTSPGELKLRFHGKYVASWPAGNVSTQDLTPSQE